MQWFHGVIEKCVLIILFFWYWLIPERVLIRNETLGTVKPLLFDTRREFSVISLHIDPLWGAKKFIQDQRSQKLILWTL